MAMFFRNAVLPQQDINLAEPYEGTYPRRNSIQRNSEQNSDQGSDHSSAEGDGDGRNNEEEKKRKDASSQAKLSLMRKKRERITRMRKHQKRVDTSTGVLAVLGIVLAFIELENNYSNVGKERNESSPTGTGLRVLVSLSTLALMTSIVLHYLLNFHIARERQTNSEEVGNHFLFSPFLKWMCVELIICSVHCPPGIDHELTFTQLRGSLVLSLDGMLATLMLLRVYIVFRLVRVYSRWANDHADECCQIFGCHSNTLFVLKSLFKERPFMTLGVSMCLSITIFGMATRTFERPYNDENGRKMDFDYVWNAMWMIVITMTTVGYGDFYPQTHMGRFVVVIACFCGVFLVSMMVVTLTESSEFSKSERRAYEILSRLKAKDESKHYAERVVKESVLLWTFKRHKAKKDKLQLKYMQMINVLKRFKEKQEEWQTYEAPTEEMLRQLTEKIDVDLEELKSLIASLIEIEQRLKKVEDFQEKSLEATNLAIMHLNDLKRQLNGEQ